MRISSKQINIIAASLLGFMLILMLSSSWNDSAIVDEVPHIGAGYSYLTRKDMRLNPEHPPLIKDLAALPLLFLDLKFPKTDPSWTQDINGQWTFGAEFIHKIGNPAEKILFWSRLPIMLLTLLLGFFVFKWTRGLFGDKAGLIALFLYALSPTIIAHGRFVTTDAGAAAGIFIASYFFVKFIRHQTGKNLIWAGITLGLAQLAKFSVFLLFPLFSLLAFIWILGQEKETWLKNLLWVFGKLILIFAISSAVIWGVYGYHVWNYPSKPENPIAQKRILETANCDSDQSIKEMGPSQFRDTACILKSFGNGQKTVASACLDLKFIKRCPVELIIWATDKPILRPMAQYLLGFLMVVQRSLGGNTAYFLGEVSAIGSRIYFPVVYFIKETLTLHIFTLAAILIFIIERVNKKRLAWNSITNDNFFKKIVEFRKLKTGQNIEWLKNHFSEFTMVSFIILYWFTSIRSNLNIGVRHLLPILPFTFVLTAGQIVKLLRPARNKLSLSTDIAFAAEQISNGVSRPKYDSKTIFETLIIGLLVFQFISVIRVWPSFLAYFNEAVGGYKQGYLYVTDSNLDWGQDLKRLKNFMDKNNIPKINLDYFGGGGGPEYFLAEKFNPWWSARGKPDEGEWFAISATFLQGAWGSPAPGFIIKPEDRYDWLRPYQPFVKIGQSIWVFKF
ncbi:MAG: glycosyltransferase family 39 protein [Parcubacteria group bacterium]|nr:glycosyltransferase family 39 protein [Parcubacteria group bacterium]